MKPAIIAAALLLSACTTPAQWCIGSCTQTNPAKLVQSEAPKSEGAK